MPEKVWRCGAVLIPLTQQNNNNRLKISAMNNEETFIMQPQNNDKAYESQSESTAEDKSQTGTGKNMAATAGAAMVGGAIGASGMNAVNDMILNHEDDQEEQPESAEAEAKEEEQENKETAADEKLAAETSEPAQEPQSQPAQEAVAQETKAQETAAHATSSTATSSSQAGQEYAAHNSTNHTTSSHSTHHASTAAGDEAANIHVVDYQQGTGLNGQTAEYATLSDGHDTAVVADLDGDGKADVMGVDLNRNGRFEENEVHNVQDRNLDMDVLKQAHAQQTANEGSADVRVVDIQHGEGLDGQTAEYVTLTDGHDTAVVADMDGDGKADVLGVDANHNGQFEEDEVHNVQGEDWDMSGYERAYAQQNGATHQASPTRTTGANADDIDEVQVLGVYEKENEYGQTMEAAVLDINGERVGVVDVDGDGTADIAFSDANHNQVIEEGEVVDISSSQLQMSKVEDAYIAQQQQEQMQQEQDPYAYGASNEQTDYNNDFGNDPQLV